MADVVVTIPVSGVQYRTWLRTSLIGDSKISDQGLPMIKQIELGPDQEVALVDFLEEASREVAKCFNNRQRDVNGVPFEYDGNNAIYRFNEAEPVLPHASTIKSQLSEDVKNAIFSYVTYLWFKMKGDADQMVAFMSKMDKLKMDISSNLYRLHD